MPWIDKSEHVLIRRRYRCDVCAFTFEMRHKSSDEPMPDCPKCVEAGAEVAGVAYIPPRPAIGTTKGKSIDLAQRIAEEDYGLTDFNDNQRVGDIAFKPPAPMHTAEREAEIRALMQAGVPADLPKEHQEKAANFWQGNAGGSAEQTIATQAVGKEASAKARDQGSEPLGILERGRATGNMPFKLNVMSKADAPELTQPGG